ncbi:hypothetical protein GCM10007897_42480 [Sphingobium jiangsuense]|uniref:NinB protein n=1 Tax=Sphingobium jiangsuense TaxID=870476 RepID=A0A7W6BPT3_9SPHN|nr:recombination protein NinB [Sphingobium jiangsuense]MBB3928911.1 hypothetical protein [Sphingobium jiangsuense]GLT02824.1 hypothetical protein GCM10007897_42480 [Sphingobium jiangsuense]
MSNGHTIILNSDYHRRLAHSLIEKAPHGAILNVKAAKRTNDQNALLWSLLSQISRAKPDGRQHAPEIWKCVFMAAAGFPCSFIPTLDGASVVPVGFKSSRLTKVEFSDLIECIFAFAAEKGIPLHDEIDRAA